MCKFENRDSSVWWCEISYVGLKQCGFLLLAYYSDSFVAPMTRGLILLSSVYYNAHKTRNRKSWASRCQQTKFVAVCDPTSFHPKGVLSDKRERGQFSLSLSAKSILNGRPTKSCPWRLRCALWAVATSKYSANANPYNWRSPLLWILLTMTAVYPLRLLHADLDQVLLSIFMGSGSVPWTWGATETTRDPNMLQLQGTSILL